MPGLQVGLEHFAKRKQVSQEQKQLPKAIAGRSTLMGMLDQDNTWFTDEQAQPSTRQHSSRTADLQTGARHSDAEFQQASQGRQTPGYEDDWPEDDESGCHTAALGHSLGNWQQRSSPVTDHDKQAKAAKARAKGRSTTQRKQGLPSKRQVLVLGGQPPIQSRRHAPALKRRTAYNHYAEGGCEWEGGDSVGMDGDVGSRWEGVGHQNLGCD